MGKMVRYEPTLEEDGSAANWKAAIASPADDLVDESELAWYDETSPRSGGAPEPASIEAARRFVSHWLEGDNHEFIIPGTEWGRSLKHWLHILVASPAPGGENLAEEEEVEATPFPNPSKTLLEQVRERRTGMNHWIDLLKYDHSWVEHELDPEDIEAALAEAYRIKAEDKAAVRATLERADW